MQDQREIPVVQDNQTPPVPQVQPQQPTPPQAAPTKETEAPKKVFSRKDVKRFVTLKMGWQVLYSDYEPHVFKLRLALSKKLEDQKEEFVAMSAVEQTRDNDKQNLDELCDLMLELPTAFDELAPVQGELPGITFRRYIEETTDPDAQWYLTKIVNQTVIQYWNAIVPRLFR